ncbi:hypothetical protein PV327_011399, partial [Microctonus hyperodae]
MTDEQIETLNCFDKTTLVNEDTSTCPYTTMGMWTTKAIALIDAIISVSLSEASGHMKLQTHNHIFTCHKNTRANGQQYRFEAPFMPIRQTAILVPLEEKNSQLKALKS